MFIYHDRYLAALTPDKQAEVNGRPFNDLKTEREFMTGESGLCFEAGCRACGARLSYIPGTCDGMLTKPEREWIRAQIAAEKIALRDALIKNYSK
jgi:hypothetical protein